MSVKQLGRYELLEQLGEGGMGAVWLARLSGSHGFEKLCIVKTVLPAIAKDADFVSRFLHEGRVLTQLVHGNIAQVLDMNEADGQLFLALEYVAGVDLSRLHENVRAANEYMPTSLVVALIAQAAEGLGAAHRKQAFDGSPLHVVHRDVSPQNIMVSYEGEVKVIDFGIAKSEARSKHTAQASVMGKLGYMAPEQARGENVDHRADQYALAIVLWELLANQPFVRRGTLTEMVVAMAAPTARPLSGLRADVSASLEAVVLKALAADVNARYPDTDAFARALTAEMLALGPPPTKPQLGEYVKQRCSNEFSAQRQLLTRVSTLRSGVTPRPLASDPLEATSLRSGPPVATIEHPLGSTQQLPPRSEVELTVPGRPSAVAANPSAATRESKLPHVAPGAPAQPSAASGAAAAPGVTSPLLAQPTASLSGAPSSTPPASEPSSQRSVAPSSPAGGSASQLSAVPSSTPPSSPLAAAPSSPAGVPSSTLPSSPLAAAPSSPAGVMSSTLPSSPLAAAPSSPAGVSSSSLDVAPSSADVSSSLGVAPSSTDVSSAPLGAAPSSPPLTTGELAAVAAPKSRTPMLVLGALGLVAVLALVFEFSGKPDEAAQVDAGVTSPIAVVDAGAPVPPSLDAAVAVAPLPPVEEVDAGAAALPPQNEPQPTLRLTSRSTGTSWILGNQNRTTWTECSLTVPGRRRAKVGTIAAGGSVEVRAGSLKVDALAPLLVGQLRVDCAQGFGFAKTR